jgi:hypothetical protein
MYVIISSWIYYWYAIDIHIFICYMVYTIDSIYIIYYQ